MECRQPASGSPRADTRDPNPYQSWHRLIAAGCPWQGLPSSRRLPLVMTCRAAHGLPGKPLPREPEPLPSARNRLAMPCQEPRAAGQRRLQSRLSRAPARGHRTWRQPRNDLSGPVCVQLLDADHVAMHGQLTDASVQLPREWPLRRLRHARLGGVHTHVPSANPKCGMAAGWPCGFVLARGPATRRQGRHGSKAPPGPRRNTENDARCSSRCGCQRPTGGPTVIPRTGPGRPRCPRNLGPAPGS